MTNERPLLCTCVDDDATPVLRDILGMFKDKMVTSDDLYISLTEYNRVSAAYGAGAVAVILCLLERCGYVQHAGNLTVSSWLTSRGIELRDSLDNPAPDPDDAEKPEISGTVFGYVRYGSADNPPKGKR